MPKYGIFVLQWNIFYALEFQYGELKAVKIKFIKNQNEQNCS
jgi:hypothetical protein